MAFEIKPGGKSGRECEKQAGGRAQAGRLRGRKIRGEGLRFEKEERD